MQLRARAQRRLEPSRVPNAVRSHEDVDVRADPPLLVQDAVPHAGRQRLKRLPDRARGREGQARLAAGLGREWSRQVDDYGHQAAPTTAALTQTTGGRPCVSVFQLFPASREPYTTPARVPKKTPAGSRESVSSASRRTVS